MMYRRDVFNAAVYLSTGVLASACAPPGRETDVLQEALYSWEGINRAGKSTAVPMRLRRRGNALFMRYEGPYERRYTDWTQVPSDAHRVVSFEEAAEEAIRGMKHAFSMQVRGELRVRRVW